MNLRGRKEVVIQEIGEAADTPDDVVFENLQAIAWGRSSRWRGRSSARRQSVRGHTTEGLRAFHGSRVSAGENDRRRQPVRVDVDDFVKARSRRLSVRPFSASEETNLRTPPQFKRRRVRHDKRTIEQTHIAVAFPGVSSREEDFFAARVFADSPWRRYVLSAFPESPRGAWDLPIPYTPFPIRMMSAA